MSEKKYSKATFKLLRGLRETTDEAELQLELARASTPSSPPQKKLVPVYGLPILAHCPKYGEFWRPKIIGHEIVNVEDNTGNSGARTGDTTDDSTGNSGAGKGDTLDDGTVNFADRKGNTQEHGDGNDVPMSYADVCYYKKHDNHRSKPASGISDTPSSEKTTTGVASEEQVPRPHADDDDDDMDGIFGVYARFH